MHVAGGLTRRSKLCCVLTVEQDKTDLDLLISETNFVLELQSS